MKKVFTVKRIARAGVIAALYVALSFSFGALAYNGIFQIRPAEALTILPLFYVEAIPALWVGCILANIASPFVLYDATLGALCTLISAVLTYIIGRLINNKILKFALGGLFPVLINALVIPVIIVFLCGGAEDSALKAYFTCVLSMLLTQSVWIYGLGAGLYAAVLKLREKGVSAFLDGSQLKKAVPEDDNK